MPYHGKHSWPKKENCIERAVAYETAANHAAGRPPLELLPTEILKIVIKMFMRSTYSLSELGYVVGPQNRSPKNPKSELRTSSTSTNKHNFLVDVIANISGRFRSLASSRSLWKGEIYISGGEKKIQRVMEGFLYNGVTTLHLINTTRKTVTTWTKRLITVQEKTAITAANILDMAVRCPNLEALSICSAK